MSHLFSNTNIITLTNTRINNLEAELSNSTSLLTQLSSDTVCTGLQAQCNATASTPNSHPQELGLEFSVGGIDTFTQGMELSLIKEKLEIATLQNTLLQIKYDLLQNTHYDVMAQNKNLLERLEAYTCSICLTKAKDCILEPCGHFVGCMSCINLLPDTKCPVCRTDCNYYIRVFNS